MRRESTSSTLVQPWGCQFGFLHMFNLTLRVSSSKRRSAISVAVVFTLFASVTSKFRPDIYSFGSASTRPTTILRSASSLAHSAMGGSSFRQWAVDNKAGYLEDVQAGHGKNWTVVMGNEAGGKVNNNKSAYNPC